MSDDLEGSHSRRRAKLVFTNNDLHRALDLPPTVRVAFVQATADPGATHVVIEGEGVPGVPAYHTVDPGPVPGADELAFFGAVEAPSLDYDEFLEQAGRR
jgi:hypothetical protein